jgi:hypothetical protein
VGTGCSTPKTASGTLDEGKERVTQLVVDAARKLPAAEPFVRPTKVGTQPCRRTVLGFVTGRTGAHRAEVPLIVKIEPGTGRQLLDVLADGWVAAGYDLDRSRIDETGFPQLRARTPEGDEVVATALTRSKEQSQIDLYAVSQCLADAASTLGPPTPAPNVNTIRASGSPAGADAASTLGPPTPAPNVNTIRASGSPAGADAASTLGPPTPAPNVNTIRASGSAPRLRGD